MKKIQVFKPYYRKQEILDLMSECFDSGWTGIGGKTIEFEAAWKVFSGAKTCHMLNSATAGLDLALKQLKMKGNWDDNCEVISTALTFVSTNHAILYNNLKPVFADVDESGCLDPESILEKVTEKTRAIIFVGLGGNVGQLKKINKIAKSKNLKLILDAAHMAGTKWNDTFKQVGCNDDCDVSVFSMQCVKNCPSTDAGMICWNGSDAQEQDALSRRLSWLGIDKDTFSRSTSEGSYKWYYDVPHLGYKYHSNAITACVSLVGLKYLEKDNAYRRYLCDLYKKNLSTNPNVKIVNHSEECISSRHTFQILIQKRDEVMLALNQYGIYPGVHYRENTAYDMYKGQSCPRAEDFARKTISLPLHLLMEPEDVLEICNCLGKI